MIDTSGDAIERLGAAYYESGARFPPGESPFGFATAAGATAWRGAELQGGLADDARGSA